MLENVSFKNEILSSNYPIDIHNKNSESYGKDINYFLPIESIKSKKFKNLYQKNNPKRI